MRIIFALAISLLAFLLPTADANADAVAGETLFKQCMGCHQVGESAKHQFGPTLNGVLDRAAATTDGYDYSSPFKSARDSGLVWTNETMDAFLAAPMQYIAGTKMAFPGIADEKDRSSLIAYLKLFDQNGVTALAPKVADAPAKPAIDVPRKLASDFVVPSHGILNLGRAAFEEEVLAWDIDIRPDGLGLPVGSGNAIDGVDLYDANCASCHGDFGEGTGRWPILAGGQNTLQDDRPEKTIGSYWPYLSTVYDYIRRAMPFGNARSLSDNDVYAITAYLLYLNDLEGEDFELNSENFSSIKLPNEANFIADSRSDEPYRSVAAKNVCMNNCKDTSAVVTQRARVLDVTPDGE